jgi:hypothetical protein
LLTVFPEQADSASFIIYLVILTFSLNFMAGMTLSDPKLKIYQNLFLKSAFKPR